MGAERVTPAHERAVQVAIETIEGRWRAAGADPADYRAGIGDRLRELLALARLVEEPQAEPGLEATEELVAVAEDLEAELAAPVAQAEADALRATDGEVEG